MAESRVLIILDKMTCLLQEELNLLKGVRPEVEFIKDELERLEAISMVADTLEDEEPELKVWVKQLGDVARHVEYVFDKFSRRPVNYRRHDHDSSCKRLASAIEALRAPHWIASDMEEIKGKLETISKGRPGISETGSSSIHLDISKLDSHGDELEGTDEKPLCSK